MYFRFNALFAILQSVGIIAVVFVLSDLPQSDKSLGV